MNRTPSNFEELQRLVADLADGALSPSDSAQLASALRDDPKARRFYLDQMAIHARLELLHVPSLSGAVEENAQADATRAAKSLHGIEVNGRSWSRKKSAVAEFIERATQVVVRPTPFSMVAAALVLAIGLAALATIYLPRGDDRPVAAPKQEKQPTELVAQVLRVHQVKWAYDFARRSGDSIHAGQSLRLEAGLVEIGFKHGATVVVKGPAVFEAIDADSGRLLVGELTAEAPRLAAGFAVETPTARLVDLGTEFGVRIQDDSSTLVHVYQGLVQVEAKGAEGEPQKSEVLRAGESMTIAADGLMQSDRNSPHANFVRRDDVRHAAQFARWQASIERLRRDSDTLALYTFAADARETKRLPNVAASGAKHDGAIKGAQWVDGRWTEKGALRFDGAESRVRMRFDEIHDDLTLAAWIRPRASIFVRQQALLCSDDWNDLGDVCWQFKKGEYNFSLHRQILPDSPKWSMAEAMPSDDVGRWTHLAVVYRRSTGQVEYYRNGEPAGARVLAEKPPVRFGSFLLGGWLKDPSEQLYTYMFEGDVDELAILRRAASAEELKKHYRAGRP
jgi:hypothetical protein